MTPHVPSAAVVGAVGEGTTGPARGPFGGRPIGTVLRALGEARHYRALVNMARRYPRPLDAVARYLFGRGAYPADIEVRTPAGRIRPRLYSRHDMLTLNEVFCRVDYALAGPARVVVDVGSNIGLSALYFLTRPSRPYCFLYEPDVRNVARLRGNLAAFTGRWELAEAAVAPRGGRVHFATEPTGRYGHVDAAGTSGTLVDCVGINDVLERALARTGQIDLVKLDIEGLELDAVRAMDPALLRRVRAVVFEAFDVVPESPPHPALFAGRLCGSVYRMTRRER